jgi:biopolymer transport protein ExbD
MKFPRNAKLLRSHFDVAPFAAVFFSLLIFVLLEGLVPFAGLPLHTLQPPEADDLPGPEKPTVAMAVDANGNLYYENEFVDERHLSTHLRAATLGVQAPLTLIIHADRTVSYDTLAHLSLLARRCGITNLWLATLPPIEGNAAKP